MNEDDIARQFHQITQVMSVKLIRDRQTGKPMGYGFVEFQDYDTARDVFTELNGKRVPGSTNKFFKLNWASHGGGVARTPTMGNQQNMGGGGMFGAGHMGRNNSNQRGMGGGFGGGGHGGPPHHNMGGGRNNMNNMNGMQMGAGGGSSSNIPP